MTATVPDRSGKRAATTPIDSPRRILNVARPLFVAALFLLALHALERTLANYRWRDLVHYLSAVPKGQVAIAILLTVSGYVVMTAYDVLALHHLGRTLPYRNVAMASFSGYAINNNLGLAGVVGTSLRYRFYSKWGLTAREFATVFVFCSGTYWLGFFLLGGSTFLFAPPPIPVAIHLPLASVRLLGAAMIVVGTIYVVLAMVLRKPLRIGGRSLTLPKPSIVAGQVVMSTADWMLAGAVFCTLLPASQLSYTRVLGVFLLAQIAGLVSTVPGGLGVFEAIALTLLTPHLPPAQILGVLVAFRGVYLLLPLIGALLLLASSAYTERIARV